MRAKAQRTQRRWTIIFASFCVFARPLTCAPALSRSLGGWCHWAPGQARSTDLGGGALWLRLAPDTEKPAGRGADGLTVSVCQSAKLGADNDAEQNALRHQADRDAGDLRNACHCDCPCVALDGGAVRSPPICALQHFVSTATPAITIALNATVKCRVVN